jgi:hypothetical protein
MAIHRVAQGSPEWHALRLGKATASRITDVCAKVKSGGFSAMRRNYMTELLLERLTGKPYEGWKSPDMLNGTLREPDARVEYELRYRCEVQQIGFVDHPKIAMAGASADAFVGEDGLLELKCPKPATHLDYLAGGVVPSEYVPQIQWNFSCNPDRQWCDFVSYNPEFPASMQLFVKRIERDNRRIAETEDIVRGFLRELDTLEAEVRARYIDRRSPLMDQLRQSAGAA